MSLRLNQILKHQQNWITKIPYQSHSEDSNSKEKTHHFIQSITSEYKIISLVQYIPYKPTLGLPTSESQAKLLRKNYYTTWYSICKKTYIKHNSLCGSIIVQLATKQYKQQCFK